MSAGRFFFEESALGLDDLVDEKHVDAELGDRSNSASMQPTGDVGNG